MTEQEILNALETMQAVLDSEGRERTTAESAETERLKQELGAVRNPRPAPRVITDEEKAEIERLNALVAEAQIRDLTAGELTDLFRNGRLGI